MAHTRKNERRVLSNDELEFVEKTRHPVLPALSDGDLNQLVNNLRERRDGLWALPMHSAGRCAARAVWARPPMIRPISATARRLRC